MKRIITARITVGRMKIIPKIPGAWKHSIAQMTLPYLQVIVQTRPDQTRPDQTRSDQGASQMSSPNAVWRHSVGQDMTWVSSLMPERSAL